MRIFVFRQTYPNRLKIDRQAFGEILVDETKFQLGSSRYGSNREFSKFQFSGFSVFSAQKSWASIRKMGKNFRFSDPRHKIAKLVVGVFGGGLIPF